ncbi:hypothetical protein T439DRAFT_134112 [Meredithblackwellia eburnea MCA 4105]
MDTSLSHVPKKLLPKHFHNFPVVAHRAGLARMWIIIKRRSSRSKEVDLELTHGAGFADFAPGTDFALSGLVQKRKKEPAAASMEVSAEQRCTDFFYFQATLPRPLQTPNHPPNILRSFSSKNLRIKKRRAEKGDHRDETIPTTPTNKGFDEAEVTPQLSVSVDEMDGTPSSPLKPYGQDIESDVCEINGDLDSPPLPPSPSFIWRSPSSYFSSNAKAEEQSPSPTTPSNNGLTLTRSKSIKSLARKISRTFSIKSKMSNTQQQDDAPPLPTSPTWDMMETPWRRDVGAPPSSRAASGQENQYHPAPPSPRANRYQSDEVEILDFDEDFEARNRKRNALPPIPKVHRVKPDVSTMNVVRPLSVQTSKLSTFAPRAPLVQRPEYM